MIPNYLAMVEACKTKYPDAWKHAHMEGDPRRLEFIQLCAADIHAIDGNVACNGKRGNAKDLSADALNILCTSAESSGRTPEGLPCVVVDVIQAAGSTDPNNPPKPIWSVYTTLVEGSGANVLPGAVAPPVPPVDCSSKFPPQDQVFEFGKALNEKYRTDRKAPLIGRDSEGIDMYVNLKGMSIWFGDYMRFRVAGQDHATAQASVFAEIDKVPL